MKSSISSTIPLNDFILILKYTSQAILQQAFFNTALDHKKMRSSKNMRLMSTDLKRLQKSMKQKTDKQVDSLVQLIDLPDFDISEFFQALSRSSNQEEVLSRIPTEKQIQFFSRNFETFIETQEELAQMRLPDLEWIPKARLFKFEEPEIIKKQQDVDKSSVLDIVDSFGAVVLEKNTKQVVKLLNIIKEMKSYEKYRPYFQIYSINQLFRESYETFIENCDEKQILFFLEQFSIALKKFLKQKSTEFISKIRTDMNVDNSARGLRKIMQKLNIFLQTTIRQCKQQFPAQKMANPIQIDIMIPKFLSDLTKQFYQTIEPCVYEKQQLSQILQCLEIVLECSAELESKGINIARDFRQLISHDLPMHMNKIIEVVIEAFDDILKEDNSLYEFKFFDSLSSLGQQVQQLNPIKYGEYGKKCSSKKGILLVNAFVIIMEPLCDDKWAFLQDNVLKELLEKVSGALETNWHYWDFCQLFYFFDRMKAGKIKHKRLFNQGQIPVFLKQRIETADKIKMECWENFQTKLTNKFWVQILSKIPKNLWEIRDYLRVQGDPQLKPTIFSLDLIFSVQMFLRDFQFRLQKIQLEHIITRFYEYILYAIEYVIYYEYHGKGANEKVFTLYKKSERILKRAKNFSLEDIQVIKDKKRAIIGMFTKGGVKTFALDLYFFTEALKIMTEYQKFNCDQFVEKISQIEAKQHKDAGVNVSKQAFTSQIEASIKVYKQQPEKIRQYMQKKRRELNKSKPN